MRTGEKPIVEWISLLPDFAQFLRAKHLPCQEECADLNAILDKVSASPLQPMEWNLTVNSTDVLLTLYRGNRFRHVLEEAGFEVRKVANPLFQEGKKMRQEVNAFSKRVKKAEFSHALQQIIPQMHEYPILLHFFNLSALPEKDQVLNYLASVSSIVALNGLGNDSSARSSNPLAAIQNTPEPRALPDAVTEEADDDEQTAEENP